MASDWPRCRGRLATNFEFIAQQLLQPVAIPEHQNQIGRGPANLESKAPAADHHKRRWAPDPARFVSYAADHYPLAVIRTHNKRKMHLSRNDRNARRRLQQIQWYGTLRRVHDLLENICCRLDAAYVIAS